MNKWLKFIIFFLLLCIGLLVYSRYIGTMGFITKEYTIYSNDMPSGFDGLKVVHITDIHYKRAINLEKINSIVEEINLINPDIVVFTGDLIDKDTKLEENDYKDLSSLLSKINSKYGKFAVLGNHDYHCVEEILNLYEDSGFKYLENSYDIIYNEKNEKIFIGGIGNVSYDLDILDKTMEYLDKNDDIDYKMILVHEPDISDIIVDNYNVNLILAGHSHNGQVRLPVIGALYTPNGAKKYYDEYYRLRDTDLYVSSGVGVSRFNYRLFNKPSINFYRINKAI